MRDEGRARGKALTWSRKTRRWTNEVPARHALANLRTLYPPAKPNSHERSCLRTKIPLFGRYKHRLTPAILLRCPCRPVRRRNYEYVPPPLSICIPCLDPLLRQLYRKPICVVSLPGYKPFRRSHSKSLFYQA